MIRRALLVPCGLLISQIGCFNPEPSETDGLTETDTDIGGDTSTTSSPSTTSGTTGTTTAASQGETGTGATTSEDGETTTDRPATDTTDAGESTSDETVPGLETGSESEGEGGTGDVCAIDPDAPECVERCPVDGEVRCGDTCIDPMTDAEYCGASGTCSGDEAGETCTGDEVCILGGCKSWGEREFVAPGSHIYDGGSIDQVITEHGYAIVIYDGAESSVWATQRSPEGVWTDPHQLSDDSAGGFYARPKIAVDGNGNAVAVWRESSDMGWARFNARSQSWGSTASLSLAYTYGAPRVFASSPQGDLMLIYDDSIASAGTEAWVRRYDAGASAWYDAERLDRDGTAESSAGYLAFGASENGIVTWSEGSEAFAKRWDASAETWGPVASLGETPYTFQTGTLDAEGNGVFVFYYRVTGGSVEPREYRAAENRWVTGPAIFQDDRVFNDNCKLAMDARGEAVLAWEQRPDEGDRVVVASRRNPQTRAWQGVVPIFENEARLMGLGVDPIGNATVLGLRASGSTTTLVVRRWNAATETWEPELTLATGAGDNEILGAGLSTDPNGRVVVVWRQEASGNTEIYARAYE